MKATRQLLSLCLVIGMTTLSYTVTLSPGAAKRTPSILSVIHSTNIISIFPVQEIHSYLKIAIPGTSDS